MCRCWRLRSTRWSLSVCPVPSATTLCILSDLHVEIVVEAGEPFMVTIASTYPALKATMGMYAGANVLLRGFMTDVTRIRFALVGMECACL